MHQLDVAAANFRSTSADFEFDSVVTDPIPDKDVQKGTVYYDREGSGFEWACILLKSTESLSPRSSLSPVASSKCMRSS